MPKDYELPQRAQDNEWLSVVRVMNEHWGKQGAKLIRETKKRPVDPDDAHSNAD